eukprot:1253054-Prymnesium_polylepis.4
MHLNGRFRAMWHSDAHFLVAEASAPDGPWTLLAHNLTGMSEPSPQWAATTFVDKDGRTYIFACNWIQETDAAALNWVGERHNVADMDARGVGLMENPSLHFRDGYYFWHESVNGTVTWGLGSDPNGGSNKGALAVWRSKDITGPYEGPRLVITCAKRRLELSRTYLAWMGLPSAHVIPAGRTLISPASTPGPSSWDLTM